MYVVHCQQPLSSPHALCPARFSPLKTRELHFFRRWRAHVDTTTKEASHDTKAFASALKNPEMSPSVCITYVGKWPRARENNASSSRVCLLGFFRC